MQTKEMTMMNGVDVAALGETIQAIETNKELAKFEFRAKNQWMGGGHNQTCVQDFYGACQEDTQRTQPFVMDADEPPVLLGQDTGANPVEYLLTALASCMTTSMAYHAAARGIEIKGLESKLEGAIDLRGFLGMTKDVRKGYQKIRVCFKVKSHADAQMLKACAMFSPVLDVVSNGTPVEIDVQVEQ